MKKKSVYIPKDPQLDFLREEFSSLSSFFTNWTLRAEEYESKGFANSGLLLPLYLLTIWSSQAGGRPIYSICKRGLDFFGGLFLLLFFSPLLVLTALAIKLTSPGPVFFRQLRVGEFGRPFNIFKFRTMNANADLSRSSRMKPLEKNLLDPRATRLGAFLRKYKIDELPQLLNVLKGEMSLVGPRPLTPEDSLSTPNRYLMRFAIRPGCTGYWQALFPNTIPAEMKLAADCRYVKVRSFGLDWKLMALTIPMMLRGERSGKPGSFQLLLKKRKQELTKSLRRSA